MYVFSKRSQSNLVGVHPDLVKVVSLALERTTVDFTVIEGLRTIDRQKQLVKKGASKTMASRHLTGHAVDLVPYIDGTVSWDWPPVYEVAEAMFSASRSLSISVVWGAAWQADMLTEAASSAKELSNQYVDMRRKEGRTPFMDGPHFQLSRTFYPL